jgi:hypothetical protein
MVESKVLRASLAATFYAGAGFCIIALISLAWHPLYGTHALRR